MLRRFLQRIGILSPPTFTTTGYIVTVFVMSEGTAQGIPRPLQVFKQPFDYRTKDGAQWAVAPEHKVAAEVATIIRRGYTRSLADGTELTYAPHTIYKVTSKEDTNDD